LVLDLIKSKTAILVKDLISVVLLIVLKLSLLEEVKRWRSWRLMTQLALQN
jgi:hypothetical protein